MKRFEGKVVSVGMTNTIVVEVFRVTPHPLYRKLVRSSKKYKVDTNGFEDIAIGSGVEITETRPISKGKYFKVTNIAGAAKQTKKSEKSVKTEETVKVESTAKVSASKVKKPVVKKTVKKEKKK